MFWAIALVKVVPWIVGGIATIFATKKIAETFGNNPKNDLAKVGIPPEKIYEDAKRHKKDRIDYHKDREKEFQEEIDGLNKKIEKLEEEKARIAQERQNTDDPEEKKRLTLQLTTLTDQINDLKGQVKVKEKKRDETRKAVDKIYDEIGDPNTMTQEQYQAAANSPNWKSYKNWGIIAIMVALGLIIILFLKKLSNMLLGAFK